MIYLDYSNTTPISLDSLDTYVRVSKEYIGSTKSNSGLGKKTQELLDSITKEISNMFNVMEREIIYTSGATESNNMVIKGVCERYKNKGKHIIVSSLEHNSIIASATYMQDHGFDVDLVPINEKGLIDIEELKKLIRDDTILVSIVAVDSEIGLTQPVEEIAKLLKDYPNTLFHTDATQAIGKVKINLDNADLVSFSAHKFFGIKGIGVLLKKGNIELKPIISGGNSTTIYRSGTPCLPLIVSLSKALRLSLIDIDNKYNKVKELNNYLKEQLSRYDKVVINSNNNSIPHILNISIKGVKPETMLHALEEYEIYISTKSACSNDKTISDAVYALTNDLELAKSSIRISISSITTKDEIDYFINKFDVCYNKLTNLR